MSMGDDNEDIIDNYMPARSLDDLDSYGRNPEAETAVEITAAVKGY